MYKSFLLEILKSCPKAQQNTLLMYVCTSFFRVDQINSTTIMTNKNRLTPHTDQK